MKVLTTFYRRALLGYRSLDEPIAVLHSRLPVEVGLLTEGDLAVYQNFRPDQDSSEIKERMRQGHRCYVSWHEGRIVDASWLATGRVHIPYLRRDLVLEPGDVYVYDSYTAPHYRGRSLYSAKVAFIMRHCKEKGYVRNVAVIAIENKEPLAVTRRLGIKFVGVYHCLRFGPWQRLWRQPWREESLPELL
jgi:GNAT superfamily N-acetyltransferase